MPERTVDGRRVAWREAGTGAAALLVHCALAHSGVWSGVMAGLGDRLAMRAIDLPGHGGTDHAPTLGNQAQAVANALASLDASPTHLIGHSFGATVALRLAIEAPERVASLTLIEPVLFALLAETNPAAFAAETAAAAPARALMAAGDWRAAAAAFLARWGGPGGPTAIPPGMIALMPMVAISDREIADPQTATLRRADLARVKAPTLLIEGAESPPAIAAILDALEVELPVARRVTVPGAGHMVPITHSQAVSDAIRPFVSG